MGTRITAIICTHNRADYLRRAVQSLVDQSLPKTLYEILVVDNGSQDETSLVVDRFASEPNLKYLFEPVLGLSQARNTGLCEARGQFVAYLDDDALAHTSWLARILEVFTTVEPQPGCVGGKVDPVWEAPRPPWLTDRLARYLAVVDWSDEPVCLAEHEWLAGVNIAFPRDLLEALGGFRTELGRKGKSLISMEESLLQQQIRGAGYSCFYDPEIRVEHCLQAERLTQEWFRKRAFWQGASQAAAFVIEEQPSALERLGRFTVAFGGLVSQPRALARLAARTDDSERFEAQCRTLSRMGYLAYLSGLAS